MHITDIKIWIPASLVLTLSVLLYLLAPVLAPFVAGAILAYLSDPLIDLLERFKLSRGLAVTLVFLVLITFISLLILLLLPVLQEQVNGLIQRTPKYLEAVDQVLRSLAARFGITIESLNFKAIAQEYWPQDSDTTKNMLLAITQSGSALISGVMFFMLTPIITFYLLRDWDHLMALIHQLMPHRIRDQVVRLAKQSDSMLSAFIRGQLLVMTALGSLYAAGLSLIGLQFGLLVGVVAGLLSFIPYLGTTVGVLLAAILYMVEYQDWLGLWKVGLVFAIGQALEGYFLTPWLVGDKIGLHPVVVIFAVLAGGQLFGFVGVLLALPASSVIAVLIREAVAVYKQSEVYLK
jgi:predicted PurR-regulated permease PerM